MAIGLSKTELLKTRDIESISKSGRGSGSENEIEVEVTMRSKSFAVNGTQEENYAEVNSETFYTKSTEEETEINEPLILTPAQKEKSTNIQSNDQNNNETNASNTNIQIEMEKNVVKAPEKEVKEDEKVVKEETSHFKEVVTGVIKSLVEHTSTESIEIGGKNTSETNVIPLELSQIGQDENSILDQISRGKHTSETNTLSLELSQSGQDKDNNPQPISQPVEEVTNPRAPESESLAADQEDAVYYRCQATSSDEYDKEENKYHDLTDNYKHTSAGSEKDMDLDIKDNAETATLEENVEDNNFKIDEQLEEEQKLNKLFSQTSNIVEEFKNIEKNSNIDSNILKQNDENVVEKSENLNPCIDTQKYEKTTDIQKIYEDVAENSEHFEPCIDFKKDEETTDLKTDVPEFETECITVKVSIQTIPLGSVSEQGILDYEENNGSEKSECNEEEEEE